MGENLPNGYFVGAHPVRKVIHSVNNSVGKTPASRFRPRPALSTDVELHVCNLFTLWRKLWLTKSGQSPRSFSHCGL